MERQVDGDEPVGSSKQLDSAEEPGKSALFPHIFIYTFLQETLECDQNDLRALLAT